MWDLQAVKVQQKCLSLHIKVCYEEGKNIQAVPFVSHGGLKLFNDGVLSAYIWENCEIRNS